MTFGQGLLTLAAGLLAGAVNAAAGGGTLIAFPVLVASGVGAVEANIACSVGLLAGYAGGSVAYRRELAGQGQRIRRLAPAAVLGGAAGALVLLATPDESFRRLAPFLILVACALLAAQPRLADGLERIDSSGSRGGGRGVWLGVLIAGVYGSYFGAGLGVVLLAVLGILVRDGLQRVNALKGLLSLVINTAGVAVFIVSGRVAWPFAAVLAVSAWIGGTLGVKLARRLPARLLRGGVIGLGAIAAAALLLTG